MTREIARWPAALLAVVLLGCGGGGGSGDDADTDAPTDPTPDSTGDTSADPPRDVPVDPEVDGPGACTVLPADNPWNTDISDFPVHENSAAFIASIGGGDNLHADFGTVWAGAPNGIPYVEVTSSTPRVAVAFLYADESDEGPYPIPADPPIEGGPDGDGDRHILMIDWGSCELWELFWAWPPGEGENPHSDIWYAGSGAYFDLTSNDLRPDTWTSADAAVLPIFPGLVRYEEAVEEGVIDHALRFTVSQSQRAFIHPATHYASDSTDPDRPPMGLRLRLMDSFDTSTFSPEVQVILQALKTYGMFVADNGSDWFISGAPDLRWDDDNLHELHGVTGDEFEVVYTGDPVY